MVVFMAVFGHFSVIDDFGWLYPVNPGVPQGSILDPTLTLLCINDLLDKSNYKSIAIYAYDKDRDDMCRVESSVFENFLFL